MVAKVSKLRSCDERAATSEAVAEQILAAEWKRQPRQDADLKTRLKGGYGKSGGGRPVAGDDADRGRRETSSAADLGADSDRTPTKPFVVVAPGKVPSPQNLPIPIVPTWFPT